jgi:hypothetical protein
MSGSMKLNPQPGVLETLKTTYLFYFLRFLYRPGPEVAA